MTIILFSILFSVCSATILPPGFIVRQFGHTRDKVSNMKVEQKAVVGEDGYTFNETIYFLKPSYFKVVVEKDGDTATLIRNASGCEFVVAGKKVSGVSCSGIKSNFYYNLLLPYGSLLDYIRGLNINAKDGFVSIKKTEAGEYIIPEDVLLFKYDKNPIFVIGLDKGTYKTAVDESRKDKDLLQTILEDIKEKYPQIWLNKNDFTPIRIYGKKNSGDAVEIVLSSYIKDANEVPFPGKITLYINKQEKVSYSVKAFESNAQFGDSVFVNSTTGQQPADISSLTENKKKLVEYLRDYR